MRPECARGNACGGSGVVRVCVLRSVPGGRIQSCARYKIAIVYRNETAKYTWDFSATHVFYLQVYARYKCAILYQNAEKPSLTHTEALKRRPHFSLPAEKPALTHRKAPKGTCIPPPTPRNAPSRRRHQEKPQKVEPIQLFGVIFNI